jgi:hypothetical protein
VAAIDPEMVYVTRSFCILEAYAACAWGKTNLFCRVAEDTSGGGGHSSALESRKKIEAGLCKINSKDARTRDDKDKRKIDEMITNGSYLYNAITFRKMDDELKKKLMCSIQQRAEEGHDELREESRNEGAVSAIEVKVVNAGTTPERGVSKGGCDGGALPHASVAEGSDESAPESVLSKSQAKVVV